MLKSGLPMACISFQGGLLAQSVSFGASYLFRLFQIFIVILLDKIVMHLFIEEAGYILLV
jgi:hypothetical protein